MDRFERRVIVVGGRRRTPWEPADGAVLRRPRLAAARRVRAALRRGRVVILRHPRWADVESFLDDIAVDLDVADQPIRCVQVDLSVGTGTSPALVWPRLLARLSALIDAPLPSAAAWPMAREGFRFGLQATLAGGGGREPIGVLAHSAHHLPIEVIEDLVQAWDQWASATGDVPPVRLLVALRGANVRGLPPEAMVVDLPDFSREELTDHLIGCLGVTGVAARRIADLIGGVPEIARRAVARGGIPEGDVSGLPERLLGTLRRPIEDTLRMARAAEATSLRLDELMEGAQAFMEGVDPALQRNGLVRVLRQGTQRLTEIRSPLFVALDRQMSGDVPEVG